MKTKNIKISVTLREEASNTVKIKKTQVKSYKRVRRGKIEEVKSYTRRGGGSCRKITLSIAQ